MDSLLTLHFSLNETFLCFLSSQWFFQVWSLTYFDSSAESWERSKRNASYELLFSTFCNHLNHKSKDDINFSLSLVSFSNLRTFARLSIVIDNFSMITVISIDFEPVFKFYFYRIYSKFSKFREHNYSFTRGVVKQRRSERKNQKGQVGSFYLQEIMRLGFDSCSIRNLMYCVINYVIGNSQSFVINLQICPLSCFWWNQRNIKCSFIHCENIAALYTAKRTVVGSDTYT